MDNTSIQLLSDLQASWGDAWYRLDAIYVPLIQRWLRRHGIADQDADDIAQDVLLIVLRKLPEFQRQRRGSFRSWLRQITVNGLRDHRRRNYRHPTPSGGEAAAELLTQLADPQSNLSRRWDREHGRHVLQYALNEVRDSASPKSWTAFARTTLEGESLRTVATELGMSVNAVRLAKSRIRARVRQKAAQLMGRQRPARPD